jgi:hypothetical protein
MKDKNLQHKYTVQIVDDVLSQLEYSENEIKLVRSLISTDALGDYIRYGDLEKNTQRIKGLAFYTGKNPMDFLELLTIFYKVDAGSYTKDAGGKESLDYLFEFNKENHKVDFSHKIKNTVEKLQQAVAYSKP